MEIGIFGGTFNPVHVQHIEIVRHFVGEYRPDKMLILPAYSPPHKAGQSILEYNDRLNMCRLAFPDCEVAETERIYGTSYAVDTLRVLKRLYPDARFNYLIGGDSMIDIFTWHNPEELFGLCKITVCVRSGREAELRSAISAAEAKGAEISLMKYEGNYISSSLIRAAIALEVPIEEYVTEKVAEYIRGNIVPEEKKFVSDVFAYIGRESTCEHIKRTVITAFVINSQLGLPFDKVFYAALLHDVDKVSPNPGDAPDGTVPCVVHQYSGAAVAERVFGISDGEILDAIRFHTTGKPDMTDLGKLIFTADMVEYGRDFPEVDKLRAKVYNDFDKGFRDCLRSTYEYLLKSGKPVCPLTERAYKYYEKEQK